MFLFMQTLIMAGLGKKICPGIFHFGLTSLALPRHQTIKLDFDFCVTVQKMSHSPCYKS